MRAAGIVALASEGAPGGAVVLRSPAVGILRGVPTPGHLLGPGEAFARMTILDRTHALLVPEAVSGVVTSLEVGGWGDDAIPVEYGRAILTLSPIEAGRSLPAAPRVAGRPGPGAAGEALPPGCHAVLSPADGVFYRRPRPGDPPYVEAGGRIRSGHTLALIEAMKAFSAIVYGGPGLPEEAEVVEIRASDASEVRHGQILFVVR